MYEILKRVYLRLRRTPIVGPFVRYLRGEQIREKLYHIQEIVDSHSNAIDSLRNNSASEVLKELYKQSHSLNVKTDRLQSELNQRLEFVRVETMLELRRLLQADIHKGSSVSSQPAKIKNRAKLDSMTAEGDLKVNVGCGHIQVDGYLNVDMRDLPGVDVVAGATELPFPEGSLSEIYAAHLIEHFPQYVIETEILPHWLSRLKPSGRLVITTPNFDVMAKGYASGEIDFESFRMVTLGGQEYEGDFHYSLFSPDTLSETILKAGFAEVDVVENSRRNGLCLEMEVRATKQ